jgi:TolB protein
LLLSWLLTGCSLWPGPAAPAARIAFVTPEGAVAVIAASGGPITQLSPTLTVTGDQRRDGRVYTWPTWAPAGQRVAFLAIDPVYTGAVLVAAADGGAHVTVHEIYGHPIYLTWSPDGRQLATLANGQEELELLLSDASRPSEGRRLISGQPLYSAWSPDSQTLLVHTGGDYQRNRLGRLWLVSTTLGVDATPIDVDPSDFRAPAWSPTGSHQLVAGDNGVGTVALFLRTTDGGLRRFVDVDGEPAAVWSPRGDRLAWSTAAAFPDYYRGLEVATVDGRQRRRLTEAPLLAFFWSPDGRRLAYFGFNDAGDRLELWVIDADQGPGRRLASLRPTRELIQLISHFDQYAQSVTLWSPDSQRLLFAGWEAGVAESATIPWLYSVAADGSGPPEPLVAGRIGFYEPGPAPVVGPATPTRRGR